MTISIVVGTFGSYEWGARGAKLAERLEVQEQVETVHMHVQGGVAEARNAGASFVSGSWICFVDADDYIEPGYIAAMEQAVEHRSTALIQPATRFVKHHPDVEVPALDAQGLIPSHPSLIAGNHLVIGTLVDTATFREVGGFDPTLPVLEDWDLWIRCWKHGAEVASQPEATYVVNVHPNGRNADRALRNKVAMQIRNRHSR